jgi:hypothetical protein
MMMESNSAIWNTLGAGGVGAMIGVVGTILTALINRQPPMAAMIDARIRTLIEGYEKRISDLQHEITKLEGKIDALTRALEEARVDRGSAGFYRIVGNGHDR